MKRNLSVLAAMAALATLSGTAGAQVRGVDQIQGEDLQITTNAAGICQGARPADTAQLNFRALNVENTGTQSQFVTCTFSTVRDQAVQDSRIVNYFGAFFSNRNTTDRTVTCTGVQGFANDTNNVYETQSVNVLANNAPGTATTGYIFFGPASTTAPLYYQNVSMVCVLPGGVSINDTYAGFRLNDAASSPPPTGQP